MAEYAAIPNFGQFTEFITQGDIVDNIYTVVINHVDMGQLPVVEAAETLKADYEKIEPLGRLPKLTTQEVESVGVKVKAVYHDDVVKEVTKTDNPITVTGTLVEVKSFPLWKAGLAVKLAEVYLLPDDKNLYKVLQPHVTQVTWKPTVAVTLWNRFFVPDDPQIATWVAWYVYKINDIVTYIPNGLKYKCIQAHTSQPTWTPPAVPALWKLV